MTIPAETVYASATCNCDECRHREIRATPTGRPRRRQYTVTVRGASYQVLGQCAHTAAEAAARAHWGPRALIRGIHTLQGFYDVTRNLTARERELCHANVLAAQTRIEARLGWN